MEQHNKIAVVDDHGFFRYGLTMALKHFKFVEFAYEAANGKEFIERQKENPADIVLMDLKMPVLDGYKAILESKKLFPDLKIIVLTMFEEDEYIRKLIAAGVEGYLLKNVDQETLMTAIKYVLEGRQYFSNELMPFFTRQLNGNNNAEKKSAILTNREKEILQLIFEGLSNEEIANKLHRSIRTVTNHRANLKVKTNSKNTACLISYGIKNKIFAC